MRREFDLSTEDVSFLDRESSSWETIREVTQEGGREVKMMWVLIHEYLISDRYTSGTATAAICIPDNYPEGQLDMVYFYPSIARKDGKPIPNTEHLQSIGGKQYQRWSRHYTAQNPWKPGEHSLETHYYLIANWLEREFEKRP